MGSGGEGLADLAVKGASTVEFGADDPAVELAGERLLDRFCNGKLGPHGGVGAGF